MWSAELPPVLPQWAAIAALGNGINLANLYSDKSGASDAKYFRDITAGTNGDCGYYFPRASIMIM